MVWEIEDDFRLKTIVRSALVLGYHDRTWLKIMENNKDDVETESSQNVIASHKGIPKPQVQTHKVFKKKNPFA